MITGSPASSAFIFPVVCFYFCLCGFYRACVYGYLLEFCLIECFVKLQIIKL